MMYREIGLIQYTDSSTWAYVLNGRNGRYYHNITISSARRITKLMRGLSRSANVEYSVRYYLESAKLHHPG